MTDLPTPQPGDIIAQKYQLQEKLGEGGFGMIFRARRREHPQEVALKILIDASRRFDDEEIEQRFQREALMADSLQHSHTVKQYEFGRTPVGHRFIAMEFLRGQNLTERIKATGPLPTDLVVRIARAVLEVLELAHRQDIVHRDLKPDNIMLCLVDGDPDFPKVLDFGAAKTTEGAHDITSAGMTLGSPAYMAPEVLTGKPPIPASDLYALGLTLGEALVARKIVQGASPIDRARAQISPHPIPLPPDLQAHPLYRWISRSIDKSLERRFQSARQMLDALNALYPPVPMESADATMQMQAIKGPPIARRPPVEDATEAIEIPEDIRILREKNLRAQQAQARLEQARTVPTIQEPEDPTEAIVNPFYRPSATDDATGPMSSLATSTPPAQPTPAPARPAPSPAKAEPPPAKKQEPRGHFGARYGDSKASPAGVIETATRTLEPSAETDYRLIKTSQKMPNWFTIQILFAGLFVSLFIYACLRLILSS